LNREFALFSLKLEVKAAQRKYLLPVTGILPIRPGFVVGISTSIGNKRPERKSTDSAFA
jgi:hypothetical protein